MKRQMIALAAGLALLVSPIATSMVSAQPMEGLPKAGLIPPKLEAELKLTEAQKAQLQRLREKTKTQMDQILTADQKAMIEKARSERKLRSLKGQLNVTEAQKAEMKKVMQAAKQELDGILTPEQKQILQQKREQMKSRRSQQKPQ
ncbi:MAG: Spy/CpxP family protein refolding chaperone [Synechococcales bacterium]|nr:Spy/CpxP family protein refolding chaperone [Synechococcales bacterium]